MIIGKSSIEFEKAYYNDSAVVVGPKENQGPFSNDYTY